MNESEKMPDMASVMLHRLRCANCARRFRPQDIIPLESAAQSGVFRLRCPMCVTERLVIGVWRKNGLRTYMTDLDREEWNHYRRTAAINCDDVLRVVQMLRAYDGDFSDILEDPIFDTAE